MKAEPIRLNADQRKAAGEAIVAMLSNQGARVLAMCMGGEHYHVLAKSEDGEVRLRMGRAKKHASFTLREHGMSGTVWAKRCGVHPIRDRKHQVNVFQYILDHASEGAWTWHFRRPVPPLRTD